MYNFHENVNHTFRTSAQPGDPIARHGPPHVKKPSARNPPPIGGRGAPDADVSAAHPAEAVRKSRATEVHKTAIRRRRARPRPTPRRLKSLNKLPQTPAPIRAHHSDSEPNEFRDRPGATEPPFERGHRATLTPTRDRLRHISRTWAAAPAP